MIHVDTHVVIWMYAGTPLPTAVERRIEECSIYISPVVQMELDLLHEIGRLRVRGHEIVNHLVDRAVATVQDVPLYRLVGYAGAVRWTRDPFDRLIVAHAKADDLPLLTKDRTILENFPLAIWDC